MLPSFKDILVLTRIQTGGLTAIVPVFGYLVNLGMNDGIDITSRLWWDMAVLGIIGLFVHIFGFVHNEMMDLRFDRQNPRNREKPLVKGTISVRFARSLYLFSIIVSVLLMQFHFEQLEATLLLSISILFGCIYNILGKRIPAMDISLAMWAFLYLLAGARAHAGLSPEIYLFALMAGLQILFNNGIIGGLKDAVADRDAGARTMAAEMGVRGDENGLTIPKAFKFISWKIKFVHVASGLFLLYYFDVLAGLSKTGKIALFAIVLLFAFTMIISQGIALGRKMARMDMLRIFAVHEISTVCFSYAIAVPFIGITTAVLLLFIPLLWFISFNRFLYGSVIVPRV